MKASIYKDLAYFYFIYHYIMFLDLMEQAYELNGNVAVLSSFMYQLCFEN